jgi:hypothetical protein|tara:strand:+ start:125 stop:343 length:219 start_codon:yes stop_codon:yes gene_type:complete
MEATPRKRLGERAQTFAGSSTVPYLRFWLMKNSFKYQGYSLSGFDGIFDMLFFFYLNVSTTQVITGLFQNKN